MLYDILWYFIVFLGEVIWKRLELFIALYDPWYRLSGLSIVPFFCVLVSWGETSAVSGYKTGPFMERDVCETVLLPYMYYRDQLRSDFFFFSWSNKHYFTEDFWAFNFHECYMKKGRGKNSLNTSMDTICWQKDATHLKWVHIQSKLFAFWFKVSVLSFVTVILPCFQSLLKSRRITRECSCWKLYTPFSRWQNHKILGGVFSPGFFFFFLH